MGRKVGYEKGVTAFAMIAEMRKTATLLSTGEWAAVGVSLSASIDALEAATRWIVDTFQNNPNAVYAVAVPYLRLFGTVGGGWMMARAMLVAQRKRTEPGADQDFYQAKITTARFYGEHVLPQAAAFKQTVVTGAESVLALAESQF